MKNWAVWCVVGTVVAGSLVALPAQAQLKELSDAAGKLAGKMMGKDVTPTAVVSGTDVKTPNVGSDKSARVMLLDKQTNRRQTLVLVANEPQTVGTVQVTLTKCISDYAATLGQDVAWLDVIEGADGNGRSAPWFSGWMFNTYPEVSTLDHPRYEVQVLGCGVKARQVMKASGSAPIVESAPVEDTESNDVAPGADPYFVPGVGKPEATVTPPEPTAAVEEVPVDTESPQDAPIVETPAAVTPAAAAPEQPAAEGEQGDLHKMMDTGQY